MDKKIKPIIARYKNKDWKPFLKDELTEAGMKFLNEQDSLRFGGCWVLGMVYYKGDSPETATDWIIVTDNGGFFKVNAIAMIWYRNSATGSICAQAIWSDRHLRKSLRNLIENGQTLPDPGYTT
jgi:hypothetical protein